MSANKITPEAAKRCAAHTLVDQLFEARERMAREKLEQQQQDKLATETAFETAASWSGQHDRLKNPEARPATLPKRPGLQHSSVHNTRGSCQMSQNTPNNSTDHNLQDQLIARMDVLLQRKCEQAQDHSDKMGALLQRNDKQFIEKMDALLQRKREQAHDQDDINTASEADKSGSGQHERLKTPVGGNPITRPKGGVGVNLMHGDCLELMAQIPDGSVDMVLCDLPYGTTRNKWDSGIPLGPLWEHYRRVCRGAIVLSAQTPFDKVLGASNIGMLKYEWVWRKEAGTGFLNAKKAPLKDHENVLVFYSAPPTYNPQMRTGHKPYKIKKGGESTNYDTSGTVTTVSDGDRYPLTVLEFSRDRDKLHPTQKPVALMEYLIRTYTHEGETVLDNTMGSGTTGVACINTGRNFIGIEKDAKYFAIAKQRIESAQLPLLEDA